MNEAAERRAAIVREVSAALQDADRTVGLIDRWWATTGWVKPDWDRIADLAVAVTLDCIALEQVGSDGDVDLATNGSNSCKNCGEPVKRETRHSDRAPWGWTHGTPGSDEGWQGVRCPGEITGAALVDTLTSAS